jgi:tetratricopeptide (TPR) repeat protein
VLEFAPVTLLLALSVVALPISGAFFPRVWYPGAVLAVGLLVAALIGGRRALPASPWARAALFALIATAALNLLSITWAPWKGAAWDAGNQLMLVAAAAWIAAIAPWRAAAAVVLACAWSAGVGIVLVVTMISAARSGHPQTYLIDEQFSAPIGYANALAALAALAAVPPLLVSARRRLHPMVQAALLALATFLVLFALLPQSRAAIVLMGGTALLAFAFAPARLVLLTRYAVMAVALLAAAGPVLHVYRTVVRGGDLHAALGTAAKAMLLGAALAFLLGLGIAFLQHRLEPAPGAVRAARRARIPALALGAVAVVVLGIAFSGRIGTSVSDRWAELKDPTPQVDTGAPRITQPISDAKRYDDWRVAWDAFKDHPFAGIGANNFQRRYAAHRRFQKYSLYAHSIELRVLSETGVVGGVLLLATLVALLGGLVTAYRRTRGPARSIVVAGGAMGVYFLAHSSVDWLEQFPALFVPVIVMLFAAIGLGARVRPSPPRRTPRALRWALASIGAVALVAVLASLVFPLLARIDVDRAKAEFRTDPAAAYRDLDRAEGLNPLSSDAQILRGQISLSRRDETDATRAFRDALGIEDRFVAYFQLALIESHRGHRAEARRLIDAALVRSPKDPILIVAGRRIAAGKRLDPIAFNRLAANPPLYIRHLLP